MTLVRHDRDKAGIGVTAGTVSLLDICSFLLSQVSMHSGRNFSSTLVVWDPECEDRLMALSLLLKWRPIEVLDRILVDVRGNES